MTPALALPPNADAVANTTAPMFDIRLRYFASGTQFTALTDLADFNTTTYPTTWTVSGETITPAAPWVEITNLVIHDGSWEQRWDNSVISMTTSLRGNNYNATYLAPGCAIACFWRITRDTYDSGWLLFWLGMIDSGEFVVEYKNGLAWKRSICGVEGSIETTDAPRLIAGVINMAEDASVTASTTLAVPESEANNGEFIGTTANVEPGNVVDGRSGTAWISQDAPITIGETAVTTTGYPVIDEVFNTPIAGYSRGSTWWIEIYHPGNAGSIDFSARDVSLITINSSGEYATLSFKYPAGDIVTDNNSYTLEDGERCIICADQRVFEAYTGGAIDAKFVLEAKSFGTLEYLDTGLAYSDTYRLFDLAATDGFVILYLPENGGTYDVVKWGSPTLPTRIPAAHWTGPGISITPLPGQSLRRSPSGTDTNTAADWIAENYPRPGAKWTPSTPQWLLLELREHESTLDIDVVASTTTLTISEGTTGWLDSGTGVIEGDTFNYTGRDSNILTGVTGLIADHPRGAPLYPLDVNNEAQTGWCIVGGKIKRRPELSTIKRARVYISPWSNCRTPNIADLEDVAWETDYIGAVLNISNDSGQSEISLPWRERPTPWVRTVLIIIDEMSDGGRAKINEITLDLDAISLADSNVADLAGATAGDVAGYLISSCSWLTATQWTNNTASLTNWGTIGKLALAISPLPTVLSDLAEKHGCLVFYTTSGRVRFEPDPWWPGARPNLSVLYTFDPASVRDEMTFSAARPAVTGLALSAVSTDGTSLARVVVPPGAIGSGVREVSGYTVANQGAATLLAWNLFWKAQNKQTVTLRVAGIGEWCRCGQRYRLALASALSNLVDVGGTDTISAGGEDSITWDETDNGGQWICEAVRYTWQPGVWTCDLTLRRFFN